MKERFFVLLGGLRQEYILVGAVLLVILVMSLLSPYFFSAHNLIEATRSASELGIVAIGMAFVLMAGGIDLSVGSSLAFCSIVFGIIVSSGLPIILGLAFTVVTGVLVGLLNGTIVSIIGLPPIITTLGTMAILRGLSLGVTRGQVYRVPESFYFLGQGSVIGIPIPFIVFVGWVLLMWFLLRKTLFGVALEGMGKNARAARFSGIRTRLLRISVFVISGIGTAIAALLFTSRAVSAKADFAVGLELEAITVAVLGGASLKGGKASIMGTFLALLLLAFLTRGLTMVMVPSEVQLIIVGALLIAAVAFGSLSENRPMKIK
jgi:ribose/xylose/arabinose/galactoside ABC-type transport system permease subunit